MEALINNLWQWLKRNKVDDTLEDSGGVRRKREKHWYNKEKVDPVCIFRTISKLRDFTTARRPDKNKFKGAVRAYQRQQVLQTDWRRVSFTLEFSTQYLLSNKNRRSIQGTTGRANCGRNDLWLGNSWWKRLR